MLYCVIEALNDTDFKPSSYSWNDLTKAIVLGGFPEILKRHSEACREQWFKSYLNSILQKNIRELANIDGLVEIPNVLELIAGRVGSTLNLSDVSRLSGIPNTTMQMIINLFL